jgi:hypothetical protein
MNGYAQIPMKNINKMSIKIATLDLCLGLTYKKNIVKQILNEEKI